MGFGGHRGVAGRPLRDRGRPDAGEFEDMDGGLRDVFRKQGLIGYELGLDVSEEREQMIAYDPTLGCHAGGRA